jgi:hypothetical protein
MKSIIFTFLLLSLCGLTAFAQRGVDGANYDYNCRCLGVERDGSITVESYGKGRNKSDASEQAQKNAVWEVLFNGIKEGNGGCASDPLLFSSDERTKNEDFFNAFFRDGGEYKKFVSLKDEKVKNKISRNAKKGKESQQRMVVVRVDRAGIKKHLIDNKIK